jgi:hypothetical protein
MGYYSFGLGLPSLVYVNVGKRVQNHHNGFDAGIGGFPVFLAHVYLNYLFYPYPSLKKEYYIGSGIKYLAYFTNQPPSIILPMYILKQFQKLVLGNAKAFEIRRS